MKNYMAIDQYGYTIHGLKNPRKDLMERCGINHASKMYTEYKNGRDIHSGYVIGRQWFTVYEVKPFKQ